MKDHTFVILAYKESEFLETCIKSLLNQTIKSNIVIATSTPNKHIESLAKKYDLPLYINEDGGTIGKDWNFALSSADTKYVTLAHQDDFYSKNYLEQILKSFEKDPDSIITFTDYHELRNNKVVEDNLNLKIKKLLLFPLRISPFFQKSAINFGCAICCPSVTYNKEKLEDYRFDENLSSNLDWKAWVELDQEGNKFNYLPKALMLHRIHEASETSKVINESNRQNEDLEVFKMIWPSWMANLLETFYSKSEISNKNE